MRHSKRSTAHPERIKSGCVLRAAAGRLLTAAFLALALVPTLPAKSAAAQNAGSPEPVEHARAANITTCLGMIANESTAVIDSNHAAISSYSESAANDNMFQSIVGLAYPDKKIKGAAAVIVAAPLPGARCAGATVQVLTFAAGCDRVQGVLLRQGRVIGRLQNAPVIEAANGFRNVLLSGGPGMCVVMSVGRM